MNNIPIATILELPVQERIRLVELIWDSVAAMLDSCDTLASHPNIKQLVQLLPLLGLCVNALGTDE